MTHVVTENLPYKEELIQLSDELSVIVRGEFDVIQIELVDPNEEIDYQEPSDVDW